MKDIEKNILKKLTYSNSLKYNEMWNKENPSSKFNYHLKKLIQNQFVTKNEQGEYTLTQKGIQHISEYNSRKTEKEKLPLTCSFTLCINQKSQVLLQKRKKKPYQGIINVPGGKTRFGETTEEASIRELYAESKLKAKKVELKIIDQIKTFDEDNKIFAHIIAYWHTCNDYEGKLEKENEEGIMQWYSLDEVQKLNDIFPNLKEIIPMLCKPSEKIKYLETQRFRNEKKEFIDYNINEK